MNFQALSLPGLKKITPQVFIDPRGFFKETYQARAYAQLGIEDTFVQDNHSYSRRGVLRGMHFQRSPGQVKLVQVIMGQIFDVVVDMRKDSPTFGKWEGVYLDGIAGEQLLIPVGCAHGFCVVSDEAHVVYKVSAPYDPVEEQGFCFDDPDVAINWPIQEPLLSLRDQQLPRFSEVCR